MEKLKEKVSESLASVLAITAIVLVLSILVVPMEIRAIMENPVLDQEKILLMQRKMLVAKKERMERLNSLRMRWRHSIRNSRIKE